MEAVVNSRDLDGRAFVVLGASGGIGAALSRRLAARGAKLLLGARRPEPLEALARELEARPVALDARQSTAVEGAVGAAIEAFGHLDGLACCLGSLLLKTATQTSDAEWRDLIDANLTVAFFALRAGVRVLERGGGSMVLCSSAAATTGLPAHDGIAAAKAGIEGLVRASAASYASRGVRVNAVAPGLVRTPLSERLWPSDLAARAAVAQHPLGRLGEPDDVASAIAWLLDPAQSWVTGQVLAVDGGLAHVRPRARA
jgi:3-oxoacyl-[acyl-carrier protein] reductase